MEYLSEVKWQRKDKLFTPKEYDRTHQIKFNGGMAIDASSAPEFLGNAKLPNPEELFTGALASCFMLTFLYLAALKKIMIDECVIEASGKLAKNSEGKMAMTQVILQPKITFADGNRPDETILQELYKKSHDQCFISSSVKTEVIVQEAVSA